jgi:Type II secretion system (T2SS), protein E, N-terminal domain
MACIHSALRRELDGRRSTGENHRHRIPLGLLMLEQGWITQSQLRMALDAQKSAATGRLGYWLMQQRAVSEEAVTRALGLQWSCPVLPLDFHDSAGLAPAMPRLFLDAYGVLPIRIAAERVLYLGFEESLDAVLALAVERMTGLRVESGVVKSSLFLPAHARMLVAQFPAVELVEAVSEAAAAYVLAKSVERARPVASQLIRVHDCLWLRMWTRPQNGPLPETGCVQDLICSICSM